MNLDSGDPQCSLQNWWHPLGTSHGDDEAEGTRKPGEERKGGGRWLAGSKQGGVHAHTYTNTSINTLGMRKKAWEISSMVPMHTYTLGMSRAVHTHVYTHTH